MQCIIGNYATVKIADDDGVTAAAAAAVGSTFESIVSTVDAMDSEDTCG